MTPTYCKGDTGTCELLYDNLMCRTSLSYVISRSVTPHHNHTVYTYLISDLYFISMLGSDFFRT